MQGAAQTANAPPSSAAEPPRRARWSRPGATARSGHGSRPANARPITTSAKPAICGLASSSGRRSRSRRRAAPRSDEDEREAGDERHAREHDPPPRAPLAEPVDVDGRDRREVAGHERQHARRHHRDEPGEERDRELLKHRSGRAPRRRGARARGRAAAPAVAGASAPSPARLRDQYQARRSRARPRRSRSRRTAAPTRAGRSRASAGRRARRGPSCWGPTSSSTIWLFVRPAAIRVRMYGLHLLRDRRVGLVERRVARRADELRLELALRRMLLARERRRDASASASTAASGREPQAATRRQVAQGVALDALVEARRASRARRCAAARRGRAVDEERLRDSR